MTNTSYSTEREFVEIDCTLYSLALVEAMLCA